MQFVTEHLQHYIRIATNESGAPPRTLILNPRDYANYLHHLAPTSHNHPAIKAIHIRHPDLHNINVEVTHDWTVPPGILHFSQDQPRGKP